MVTIPPTGSPQDGATVRRAAPAFIEVGHIIASRYEIRRLLGRGAMGEVWLAFDLKLRVEVALKDLTFRRDDREMIRREVRTARDVVSPNVCRVFDLVEADGRELLSMEYVDGVTLRNVIEERSPLDLTEAQTLASQLLAGLESIHAAGLVHRDVKPENVMITRTGRVAIMDFGLAREARSDSGSIAGTPAYMSPEQARGDPMDPRTDIFAVGVLLAEIVTGARTREARTSIWEGIRKRPAEIADGPWAAVLRRAVSRDRSERFESAREMARALEQVTLRVATAEDRHPYPGLAAFTERQTEFFFGREAEVEVMLRKLERFHLLALIGPSGAGKSSFLRAGVLPMLPKSWGVLLCHPGAYPFANVGEVLAPQLPGDAVPSLVRFQEIDTAIALMRRWRSGREQALVVIDQFEEIFTLNGNEVQERFVELIGRLVLDADVHVLISLRDDFLMRCHDFAALEPVLSELTALSAPAGAALRRALLQPALRCGYRFEDDALVESMLTAVGEERGTLPLLAFAAAQLWEKRDREAGLLTRSAYEEIGGVTGALARHADAVLERIGKARVPIVREIFRNVVTSQGTRAARDRNTLLSVFSSDREQAERVLDLLIEARLLTSHESTIEITHESLLVAWPRLVQWRVQDQEGAILRDQLRQAAQLWEERGRAQELLWTGRAYREFLLWKERYPGALSELEDAFAKAMVRHANRRRRRLRASMFAAAALALTLSTVMTVLWRRSVNASRRLEAQKVLGLAQLEIDRHPTAALAYVTRSLELLDTPAARSLVMEILWRGPVARVLEVTKGGFPQIDFSPDGTAMAVVSDVGSDAIIPHDGTLPRSLELADLYLAQAMISPDGRYLVVPHLGGSVRVFSFPDGRFLRTFKKGNDLFARINGLKLFTTLPDSKGVVAHHLDSGENSFVGTFDSGGSEIRDETQYLADLHPSGSWAAFLRNGVVYKHRISPTPPPPTELWRPRTGTSYIHFDESGQHLIAASDNGAEVVSLASRKSRWLPIPANDGTGMDLPIMNQATVAGASGKAGARRFYIWDLANPPDADPLTLRWWSNTGFISTYDLHPGGSWFAASSKDGTIVYWPLSQPYVRTIRIPSVAWATPLHFAPDGRRLAVCVNPPTAAKIWALDPEGASRTIAPPNGNCTAFSFDPTGNTVLAGADMQGFFLHTADGTSRRVLATPQASPSAAFFDPSGKIAVMAVASPAQSSRLVHVLHLESGTMHSFPSNGFNTATFAFDGSFYSGGNGGVHRWDLTNGKKHVVHGLSNQRARIDGSRNGETILAAVGEGDPWFVKGTLQFLDLKKEKRRRITTHGDEFNAIAVNAAGTIIATADKSGMIRIGNASGDEPHLLPGHKSGVHSLAFSPDGRWLASLGDDEIRLWPIPDVTKPPLHTLPHDQLMSKLAELTNLRAVPDNASTTGYKLEVGPFPGWKDVPAW